MLDRRPVRVGKRTGYRPVVAALAVASLLQWLGASAVLPLLPLYLQRRGSSAAMVGAVMAAYFGGAVLAQYLAGRLGDRIGHRPVLVLGLLGYGVASAGFLLDLGGWGYLTLRAGQGAAAGSAQVAILAFVVRVVPREVRGRAFSSVYGAELAGIAIGPLLGSAVGVAHMGELFVIAAGAAVVACLPVLLSRRLDSGRAESRASGGRDQQGPSGLRLTGRHGRVLVGVLIAAVVSGVLTGVYEACWSMLLDHRGATTWQIGASWTLFAVPFVVVAPLAGWLADHYDRRWLVVIASLTSVGFAVLYPFLDDVSWLIGLGAVESMGVAVATPAAQSLLADATAAEASGRAQGVFASTQTAAIAASAAAGGGLFAIAPWVPFVTAGAVGVALVTVLPAVWRNVPGRVTRVPSP